MVLPARVQFPATALLFMLRAGRGLRKALTTVLLTAEPCSPPATALLHRRRAPLGHGLFGSTKMMRMPAESSSDERHTVGLRRPRAAAAGGGVVERVLPEDTPVLAETWKANTTGWRSSATVLTTRSPSLKRTTPLRPTRTASSTLRATTAAGLTRSGRRHAGLHARHALPRPRRPVGGRSALLPRQPRRCHQSVFTDVLIKRLAQRARIPYVRSAARRGDPAHRELRRAGPLVGASGANLTDRVYVHELNTPWPTLGELVDDDVVLFWEQALTRRILISTASPPTGGRPTSQKASLKT